MEDEGVDGMADPARLGDTRNRWLHQRLERPPIVAGAPLRGDFEGAERAARRPRCSGLDPSTQVGDLLGGERPALFRRRHGTFGDAFKQVTFLGLAGHDHGSRLASPVQALGLREVESALGFRAVMAAHTVLDEDGRHGLLKIGRRLVCLARRNR